MQRTRKLTTKSYSPLPVVVGKVVVWGRRDNSICGLSFGSSHGSTIDDDLKYIFNSYKTFVKNAMDMKTHHQIILAAACCCWQGGGVGQEG